MKTPPPSADLAERFRVEDAIRVCLGTAPGESILDSARRVLAKRPGPGRPMTRVRVAIAITNDPAGGWSSLRRAAAMVNA